MDVAGPASVLAAHNSNHHLKVKAISEDYSNNHHRQPHCGHAAAEQPVGPVKLPSLLDGLRSQPFSWQFNIFDLAKELEGRTLITMTITLLEHYNLLDGWKVDRKTMERFLARVESEYNPNSYHNATHGADVTQTAAIILESLKQNLTVEGVNQQDTFCIIVASAVHDLGHLGFNNDFLINSKHARATTYNDKSVNEMYHISRAFEIARESKELDIFSGFEPKEQKAMRKLMIDMVLATDMAIHFDLLGRFKDLMEKRPDINEWKQDTPERSLLYQMTVHLADIANPSRPFPVARGWAERVIEEFIQQGDEELRRGMEVTPFCNYTNINMPKAQLGFIGLFLEPTLQAFKTAAPSFGATALEHLALTIAEWNRLDATGLLLPEHLKRPQKPNPN